MLKRTAVVIFSVFILVVSAGCGQSHSSDKSAGNNEKATTVQSGAKKMISLTSDLKKQLSSQPKPDKVKAVGEDLETTWSSFEDKVKKNNPSIYKEVEDSLDPLVTGTKQKKLDTSILTKLDQQLHDSVQELIK